jgi:hypothetical protein
MSAVWMSSLAATHRFVKAISAALLMSLAIPALGGEDPGRSLDCTPPTYAGQQFRKTFEQAKVTAAVLCDVLKEQLAGGAVDDDLLESHLMRLEEVAAEELASKNLQAPANYARQFDGVKVRFTNVSVRNLTLPEFVVVRAFGDEPSTAQFNAIPDGVSALQINEVPACAALSNGNGCAAVFEDFGKAFNAYRGPYENLYDNTELLETLTSDWGRFLEVSRSQTSVEVLLTTLFNRKHFQKNHLVGPPPFQVIALHPDLAYSYVKSNPDGQNDAVGISIEWLGVNFWDAPVPLGLSVATLYFDRAGIKDAGIGLQLHAYNRFSVGWSRNGSKDVYYLNLDLMKFFQQKGQQYQSYLDAYF